MPPVRLAARGQNLGMSPPPAFTPSPVLIWMRLSATNVIIYYLTVCHHSLLHHSTNHSSTCSYSIGLAIYRKLDTT